MVVSSWVVEATPGKVRSAACEIRNVPGVSVHNYEGYKIIVTIEAESFTKAQRIAMSLLDVNGVFDVNLIYADSEDDIEAV